MGNRGNQLTALRIVGSSSPCLSLTGKRLFVTGVTLPEGVRVSPRRHNGAAIGRYFAISPFHVRGFVCNHVTDGRYFLAGVHFTSNLYLWFPLAFLQ